MSSKSSHHEARENSDEGPRWKRVHHSWLFWLGVVITLAAILAYVFSMDLAIRPGVRPAQPTPGNVSGTP